MRYIVNLLTQLTTIPYHKDDQLTKKFQHIRLINLETIINKLDESQLIILLNASMESVRRPFCLKEALIKAFEWFSPLWHEERNLDAEQLSNLIKTIFFLKNQEEIFDKKLLLGFFSNFGNL